MIDLRGGIDRSWLIGMAVVLAVVLVGLLLVPEREPAVDEADSQEFDAFAGGYPVPPMPTETEFDRDVEHQGGNR